MGLVGKVVLLSVRNHWLFLLPLVAFQLACSVMLHKAPVPFTEQTLHGHPLLDRLRDQGEEKIQEFYQLTVIIFAAMSALLVFEKLFILAAGIKPQRPGLNFVMASQLDNHFIGLTVLATLQVLITFANHEQIKPLASQLPPALLAAGSTVDWLIFGFTMALTLTKVFTVCCGGCCSKGSCRSSSSSSSGASSPSPAQKKKLAD
eukprot:gnl/Hemi2/27776_TR9175_c0_g1_i1.p1 gnl/Hemi2/27776_TR9175_c0_g1~~gnl/Hemi2/27776_TR9175_c0_g1_i1.p1  ORF type:complete len:204 (-),score=81.46 gnl/Hemi2/27776_TR9175_c0_g1_i1:168-779(-)